MAAKIRKGDKVIVLAGRDKGRTGEVIEVRPDESRAFVDFAFGFRLSHRSQLPTAWPPVPCVDSRPRPRT